MRTLNIGTQEHTKVVCRDEPFAGGGGACHFYEVHGLTSEPNDKDRLQFFARVHFQKGPVKEAGVNGCHNEDLLAIVMDRLQHFQQGDFACESNQQALHFLDEAMNVLRKRTDDRKARGVEGTSTI